MNAADYPPIRITTIKPTMADEGPDLDFCRTCNRVALVEVVRVNGWPYCREHAPVRLKADDYDLIYEKAGVDGPKHKGWFSRIFRV